MESKKKWLALIVEIEYEEDGIYSILPSDIETQDHFTLEELRDIYTFLREDDDASFDFMWDLRALVARERDEIESL